MLSPLAGSRSAQAVHLRSLLGVEEDLTELIENLRCPACAWEGSAPARTIEDFEYRVPARAQYATCLGCGSLFQTPMPDGATLATYYPADYHGQSSRGAVQNLRHDVRLRGLSRRLTRPGAIVDYGCGNGGFLVHVSRKIHDRLLIGYEIAERPERQSLEGGRVTIIRGSLDDLLRELPECAVVTMNHVIEHLPDPLAVVSSLVAKVGPEGWFEGQTPAAQSLEHAVFGRHWSGFHAPRHTVVFSPRGLRSFLERVALTEIQVERGFNPAGIAVSLASLFSGRDQGIHRQGPLWMLWLGIATALSAIDFLSGRSGMLNFAARKRP